MDGALGNCVIMKKYETFSTTADVGIRIRGKDYEDLFQNAVKGLNLLYFGEPEDTVTGGNAVYPFEFRGDSCENVLVNVLSEIVFLLQNQNKITTGMTIKAIDETYIDANLLTIPCNREPEMEIKSVTYHNLRIEEENGILSTEIVFDV